MKRICNTEKKLSQKKKLEDRGKGFLILSSEWKYIYNNYLHAESALC